ncbi:MAG: YtxH domain-containing protein [Bacteroidota bacterium]
MEDTNNNNGSYSRGFLMGALVGGAIGGIVALLFAPKSGRDLRRDIADKTEEVYDKAQKYFNKDEAPREFDDVINEGRLRAERIVTSARSQAENILSSAEQVLRDAKSRAHRPAHGGGVESHSSES